MVSYLIVDDKFVVVVDRRLEPLPENNGVDAVVVVDIRPLLLLLFL
jgi:hypothetical protein